MRTLRLIVLILACYLAGTFTADLLLPMVFRSLHRQHSDLQQRNQVQGVVVQHTAHQPGITVANEIMIGGGNLASRDVLGSLAAAEVTFQGLQSTVGQLSAPAAPRMVQQVAVAQVRPPVVTLQRCQGRFRLEP